MPRGAAGEELDARQRAHVVGGELEGVEADLAGLEIDPAAEGVAGSLGLLEDLLQHEVLVAALLDLLRIPVEARHRSLHGGARAIPDLDLRTGEPGDVAVVEEDHVSRVSNERRRIRAEDERRALPHGDDLLAVSESVLGADQGAGIHAFELADRALHCRREVAGVVGGDEVGDHLGVGVGRKGPAFGRQAALDGEEVLDDAVVDDRDAVLRVDNRMGVAFGRFAVCRPAGVGDAVAAGERLLTQTLDQPNRSRGTRGAAARR